MAALNYGEIGSHPEKVSNIKPFISKYKWDEIKYPSKIDDQKTFEKSDPTIAHNVLYIKEMEMYPGYLSKIISDCEKQIIVLMISN